MNKEGFKIFTFNNRKKTWTQVRIFVAQWILLTSVYALIEIFRFSLTLVKSVSAYVVILGGRMWGDALT